MHGHFFYYKASENAISSLKSNELMDVTAGKNIISVLKNSTKQLQTAY